jgi:hypothetical protein
MKIEIRILEDFPDSPLNLPLIPWSPNQSLRFL